MFKAEGMGLEPTTGKPGNTVPVCLLANSLTLRRARVWYATLDDLTARCREGEGDSLSYEPLGGAASVAVNFTDYADESTSNQYDERCKCAGVEMLPVCVALCGCNDETATMARWAAAWTHACQPTQRLAAIRGQKWMGERMRSASS